MNIIDKYKNYIKQLNNDYSFNKETNSNYENEMLKGHNRNNSHKSKDINKYERKINYGRYN